MHFIFPLFCFGIGRLTKQADSKVANTFKTTLDYVIKGPACEIEWHLVVGKHIADN